MQASIDPKTNELVIRIPANISAPPVSPSGKTRSVASSRGNVTTSVTVQGRPLIIGLNAYIANK